VRARFQRPFGIRGFLTPQILQQHHEGPPVLGESGGGRHRSQGVTHGAARVQRSSRVRAGGDTGGQVFQLAPRQHLSIGRVSCHNKLLGGCPDPAIGADHDAVVLNDAAIDASLGQRLTIGPQNRRDGRPLRGQRPPPILPDLVNSPSATLQNQLASDSAFALAWPLVADSKHRRDGGVHHTTLSSERQSRANGHPETAHSKGWPWCASSISERICQPYEFAVVGGQPDVEYD
jgi:hypothetical protein